MELRAGVARVRRRPVSFGADCASGLSASATGLVCARDITSFGENLLRGAGRLPAYKLLSSRHATDHCSPGPVGKCAFETYRRCFGDYRRVGPAPDENGRAAEIRSGLCQTQ